MDTSKSVILMKKLVEFLKDNKGATSIEYGLMLISIASAVCGIVTFLGQTVNKLFTACVAKWP